MDSAARYLRSSKDRHDIAIDAQRRELDALASARGLTVVEEFVDVVESGASEDRPGFQQMLAAIKNSRRGWTQLLIYDTSRIARRRHIAQAIKHECRKRGVTILYARIPTDLDPITEVVLESSFEAMDEVHSLMSREKGLAGMRENVRKGYRAGGRAPMGYKLEYFPTGAIREGQPVMKSRLVLGDEAARMRRYLQGRAAGESRAWLARDLKFTCNASSLIGVEWNALTYAGHTVWNVHREPGSGTKRRPRDEWVIQRDTHKALITEIEAESVLTQLVNSPIGHAVSRAKTEMSPYLLTGLLVTSDGRVWTGKSGRYYKLRKAEDGRRGKLVARDAVDNAVLSQITEDMRSEDFLLRLLELAKSAGLDRDPSQPLRSHIAKLEREKARAAELALTVDDAGTFTAIVEARARHIAALRAELAAADSDALLSEAVRSLTAPRLREFLLELGGAEDALSSLVDHVLLEPDLTCQIHYRAALGRSRASPRGFDGSAPTLPVAVAVGR